MEKRRLYFDMDGVLVDFQSGIDRLSDEVAWITKYLDDVFHKRIVITHCKHLLCRDNNDYLIDDRTANGASEFGENLILFGSERYPNWESVLAKLLPAENSK